MKEPLLHQYSASLEMLRRAIDTCPEAVWFGRTYKHRTWHIFYHTLFYTDLYSCRTEGDFKPWTMHEDGYHSLGPIKESSGQLPVITREYSKADIAEYLGLVTDAVTERISSIPIEGPSGFPWLDIDRLGAQIYNIRHIQHHMGQLNERIVNGGGNAVGWIVK